jgi:hypothetical protein
MYTQILYSFNLKGICYKYIKKNLMMHKQIAQFDCLTKMPEICGCMVQMKIPNKSPKVSIDLVQSENIKIPGFLINK